MWTIFQGILSLQQLFAWFRRQFAISPSRDLERSIYLHQVYLRRNGLFFMMCWYILVTGLCLVSLYRVVHNGSLMDIQFAGLEACEREEPDLALLSNMNERFFLWRVLQNCFLSMYISWGGVVNNEFYRPLPNAEQYRPGSEEKQHYNKKLDDHVDRERADWGWFE